MAEVIGEILLQVGKRNSEEWDKIEEALKPVSEYKISYSNKPKFLSDGKNWQVLKEGSIEMTFLEGGGNIVIDLTRGHRIYHYTSLSLGPFPLWELLYCTSCISTTCQLPGY